MRNGNLDFPERKLSGDARESRVEVAEGGFPHINTQGHILY